MIACDKKSSKIQVKKERLLQSPGCPGFVPLEQSPSVGELHGFLDECWKIENVDQVVSEAKPFICYVILT